MKMITFYMSDNSKYKIRCLNDTAYSTVTEAIYRALNKDVGYVCVTKEECIEITFCDRYGNEKHVNCAILNLGQVTSIDNIKDIYR